MQSEGSKLKKGIIQIYWGNGKGKTTAAVGQAIRALGYGFKVYMTQFLKPTDCHSGEILFFQDCGTNITLSRPNRHGFLDRSLIDTIIDEERGLILKELKCVMDLCSKRQYDIFILDESITALNLGMLEESDLVDLLNKKDTQTEVILTGLKPTQRLMDMADLVTEMRLIKHPYQSGLKARIGIEY